MRTAVTHRGVVTLFALLAATSACGGDDEGAKPAGMSAVNGSGAGPGGAGTGATPSCQQVFDHAEAQCPGGGYPPLGECEDNSVEFQSTGCTAWAAWLSCASTASFTCEGLFAECDIHWQGIQQCRAATAATGCVRITSVDDQCMEPTPFGYACFGNPPSESCLPLASAAAVPYYCCPAAN